MSKLSLRSGSDWVALTASALAIIGGEATWFAPISTACTSKPGSASNCQHVNLLTYGLHGSLPLGILLFLLTFAFGLLPFWFRRTRWLLWTFGGFLLFFYVISFGVDLLMLPAAIVSFVAALLLPGKAKPSAT